MANLHIEGSTELNSTGVTLNDLNNNFRKICYELSDISDLNNIPAENGFYMGSNKSNSPSGYTTTGWWYVEQFVHLDSYRKQIAYGFNSEDNNIKIRTKAGGTWGAWDSVKTENTMHYNSTNPSTAVWTRVCRVKFASHVQGEMANIKIYIEDGNNGQSHQNAYIELVMQQAWTGANSGRAGCAAELHAMNSNFKTENTDIKVIANDTTNYNDYYVWVYTNATYNRINYHANSSNNCTIWDAWATQSSAPSGTECNMKYKYNDCERGNINSGADNYIKYDSGVMVCFGKYSTTLNVNNAFGNGYYATLASHSYASTFKWTPALTLTPYATSGLYTFSTTSNSTTAFAGFIWTCRSTANQAFMIDYFAIGFWK